MLQAVLAVLADAACVCHHVGDVVLLVDAVQQVGHGALGKHGHVLSSVSLRAERDSSLGLVVVFLWTRVKENNEAFNAAEKNDKRL